jgi:hypothetical protein
VPPCCLKLILTPRLEDPSSRLSWVRVEALLNRKTKARESGRSCRPSLDCCRQWSS